MQAQTYKEDFETERNDRQRLASKYEEEKAAMSLQHQTIVGHLKQQIEGLEYQIELKRKVMKEECARLEGEIQNLKEELKKVQDQNDQDKDALHIALTEKQSLEETHSKLDDKYREKEAYLEKALAHSSDLDEQLKKSRANHEHEVNELQCQLQQLNDHLHHERTELQQQITKANENTEAWRGECQSKTQQVKQYKKQADQLRTHIDHLSIELRDNRAKIAEYEQQLGYYQKHVRQLNEDAEQKVN